MKQWLQEFKQSWQDKTFLCGFTIFALSYLLLMLLAMILSKQVYATLITGIAGWQIASWSWRLAPKLKAKLFKD
jgi:hypothetical protein